MVMKRAAYFITCAGKMQVPLRMEEDYILRKLLDGERAGSGSGEDSRQMTLFEWGLEPA